MMKFRIVWKAPCDGGHLELRGGQFVSPAEVPQGTLEYGAEVTGENTAPGDFPTLVRVICENHPFTFFLRDVINASPIWYPLAQCAITTADDHRTYDQIAQDIQSMGVLNDADRMSAEAEETYEDACRRSTKDQEVPVWLGIARDARFFQANKHIYEDLGSWGEITVWNHAQPKFLPDRDDQMRFIYEIGPGSHGCHKMTKRLQEGVLPILHVTQSEQTVDYRMTFFATKEKAPLSAKDTHRGGTDPIQAYDCMSWGHLRPEEKAALPRTQLASMGDQEDALVCWIHVEAVNLTHTPVYAFFRMPHLTVENAPYQDGLLHHGECGVICACSLDGVPVPQREMAVLIPADGKVVCDWRIAHECLPLERGKALLSMDYQAHLDGALEYWHAMLDQGAKVHLPENAIQERLQAGLLHLELNTLGHAQGIGPLLAAAGVYAPIGTESSPMILFLDAMGRHDTAARCIQWFLQRQDERGYINSYADYESETGPVLWCVARHYLVTRDKEWLKSVLPQVEKSARFLLGQRKEAKALSHGLVAGKSSDPQDKTCAYFLNAGIYLGLSGLAEILPEFSPELARELAMDVADYRQDIRRGLEQSAMESPLTPLLDGTWTPALGPWPGINGNVAYHADGGEWFSHGTIFGRLDSGAMALFLTDALPAEDVLMDLVLKSHQHPQFRENCGLSQPYYFRHDIAHLKRGETKLFLKCFYNQVVSLQDRQSYTFWEHYFHVTSQKTHEEAWFLMQCRWMLALEENGGLTLLKGIPRKWLENGQEISFQDLCTEFGKTSLHVTNTGDAILGHVTTERPPAFLKVRLPHPQKRRPLRIQGGAYDPETETITLNATHFRLEYTTEEN